MDFRDLMDLAFIFPGAGMNSLHNIMNGSMDSTLKERLYDKAQTCKAVTGINVWSYINTGVPVQNEELAEQVVLYTVNCTVGEYLQNRLEAVPSMLCGYSMGIYSAVVYGKAISFESGLDMVQKAYSIMSSSMKNVNGAMAAIIGLNRKELEDIIEGAPLRHQVQIANENGEYNLIITGIDEDVRLIMRAAEGEGALKVLDIKVSLPYHHTLFLKDAAEQFLSYLNTVKISKMEIPLLSSLDQKILISASDIRFELYKNLMQNMFWHKSVERMISKGVKGFVEVGMGGSLQKIVNAINKNYRVFTYRDFSGGCYELQQSV